MRDDVSLKNRMRPYAIILFSLILSAFAYVDSQSSKSQGSVQILESFQPVSERLGLSLTGPLWNYATAIIETTIHSRLHGPNISSILMINGPNASLARVLVQPVLLDLAIVVILVLLLHWGVLRPLQHMHPALTEVSEGEGDLAPSLASKRIGEVGKLPDSTKRLVKKNACVP